MEARLAELDSSDYDGESPSTVSLVSRHVHQLQLDLNTLRAHVLACQRRILQLEEEIVALRAQTPQSSWRPCCDPSQHVSSAELLACREP